MHKNKLNNASFRTILLLCTILMFLLMPTYVLASNVTNITVTDYLQYDLSLKEMITIKLSNNTDKSFSIVLPEKSYNYSINNVSSLNNTLKTALNCTECAVTIQYHLDNAVRKDNTDLFIFDRTLNFPRSPTKMNYFVYLPKAYSVDKSTINDPSVAPLATAVLTDGGNIILNWAEDNPKFPKQYHIRYVGPENIEPFGLWNEIWHLNIWILIITAFIIGILLGAFTYGFWHHKTKPAPMPMMHKSLLSPDEQKIMAYLKSVKADTEPVNQKEIGRALSWSKSKVSAILTNLDYKKLIEREKFGRNYKVKMIKDLG